MPRRARSQVTEQTAERRALVVRMRRARRPWDEIGAELGVSPQRAHTIYREALAARPSAEVDEHRAEALELIERATAELLDIATSPRRAVRARLDAWTAILRWAERHARVTGIDAPSRQRVEVITEDAVASEIRRLEEEVASLDVELSDHAGIER